MSGAPKKRAKTRFLWSDHVSNPWSEPKKQCPPGGTRIRIGAFSLATSSGNFPGITRVFESSTASRNMEKHLASDGMRANCGQEIREFPGLERVFRRLFLPASVNPAKTEHIDQPLGTERQKCPNRLIKRWGNSNARKAPTDRREAVISGRSTDQMTPGQR